MKQSLIQENRIGVMRSNPGDLITIGLILLMTFGPAQATENQQPNVLVIMADDLGYGDVSYMGHASDVKTPHIDSLAARGMRFDEFYANCPVCSPTRAALLSGRYQEMVGVPGVIRTHAENSWGYLNPNATLLPQLFQKAGYHTGIVGKWHLGLHGPNIPNKRGFDFFHGFLGDMMDDYYTHQRHGNDYMYRNETAIKPKGHATDLFTKWACDYLRERKQTAPDRPWLLYLAYNAPHTPIQPPSDWLKKVQQRHVTTNVRGAGAPTKTDERRSKLVALIEHMDDGIGKVLKALEESEQKDNTVVVFTSDNGGQVNVGANNGPLRDGKQSVYEGGLKVPTCVVWPGKTKPNTRTNFRAMSMDILPTVMDAVGIDRPTNIEGRSFKPILLGRKQEDLRKHWFFARREGGLRYQGKTIEAVRQGRWKLLHNSPFEPMELYDLIADPLERENLANKNRGKFNELSAALRKQQQRYGTVPWQAPGDQ